VVAAPATVVAAGLIISSAVKKFNTAKSIKRHMESLGCKKASGEE
jgi:hypothetical protein